MGEVILAVENLTKTYLKVPAVNHVSMSVNQGDIYGFIGANGAGKTTFMRMICGLVKPTEGQIKLFGASGTKALQDARKKMGALIEHPAIYPNMSAVENLEIQMRYLGMNCKNDSREEAKKILELVGLGDTGLKRAGQFSLGMKQRLGLAIALIGNPKCIILDEPSIGLDPVGVVELRSLLLQLNQEKNLTIFFSSHNLSEMERLATRYGFMHKGNLMKEISAEQLETECKDKELNLEQYFLNLIAKYRADEVRK